MVNFIVNMEILLFVSDWDAREEDSDDINVWEDNWDDDNIEDDFSKQLK